ncbi:MAG: type II secretion system protein [Elusimicrobia bacterium]|nr:type II secretion system protein [Elusimicrobiota bacterium]
MNERRRGYTLTELMLVVAILGAISTLAPLLLVNLQNFYMMTTARSEVQRDARVALDNINRFLRQGVFGSITIDTPDSGGGPYSRIRFRHVDGRYVEFRQQGNRLIRVVGNTNTVLSRNLLYVAFSYPRSDDPGIVSVSMTMGKNLQLGRRKVLELTIQKVRVMN